MSYEFKPDDLKSPNARASIPPRSKPYKRMIHYGLTLGYRRRPQGAGTWIAIVADGKGGQHEHWLGFADDKQAASHEQPRLSFKDANAAAEKYAKERAANGGLTKADPPTIDEALTEYKAHLTAQGRNPANEQMPRIHLTKALLATRTDQVSASDLKNWRDGLIAGAMKRSTCNRVVKPLVAALNLKASLDKRVKVNADAWTVGLKMLDDATVARDAILSKAQVRAVVAEAYNVSAEFGLYVQMHAETGARASQLRTLAVRDFKGDRVMIPPHNKGRKGTSKKRPTPVPVHEELAKRLVAAVGERAGNAPLLLREDGRAWEEADQRYRFERARKLAKLPVGATLYWLRHNSIAHALLDGAPVWIVADWHTTSVPEIQNHYGAYIKDHHDDIIRKYLLNTAVHNATALLVTPPSCGTISARFGGPEDYPYATQEQAEAQAGGASYNRELLRNEQDQRSHVFQAQAPRPSPA